VEDSTESSEVWDFLKTMLINPREQRIAYLLFHCGLKPREMMRFCPWEFSDVHEIYRLRLCWLLSTSVRKKSSYSAFHTFY
jgi:hypothetical protein